MRRTITAMMVCGVLALAPIGAWAQSPSETMEELLVQGADTPAEHQALAAYYRDKAAEARGHAAHHKAMAERYGKVAAYKGRGPSNHCEKLVSLNEQAAAEFDALAQAQEAAAAK